MARAGRIRKAVAGAFAIAFALVAGSAAPEVALRARLAAARPDTNGTEESTKPGPAVAWAQALAPIAVENANTGARANVRLYAPDGGIDPVAFQAFARTVSRDGESAPLDPRVVQLAFKAAYGLGAKRMVIISAYRPAKPGTGGPHASGDAIDFKLAGVDSRKLASLLRGYPRAGVGIYTHPRTQYVHLDVRDKSFHWLDASPPGRTWREARLSDRKRDLRDESYTPEGDLPK